MRADIVIGDLFRGREAKKAERAESKKARDAEKAKLAEQNATVGEDVEPDSIIVDAVDAVDAVEVEHALVIDGSVFTLSQAEAIALRDYLTTLRTPALKVA